MYVLKGLFLAIFITEKLNKSFNFPWVCLQPHFEEKHVKNDTEFCLKCCGTEWWGVGGK